MKNESNTKIFSPSLQNRYPLPQELCLDAERKWTAFLEAAGRIGVSPPDEPRFLAILKRVWAFSDFVAWSCIRDPALLYDLFVNNDLIHRYEENEYGQTLKRALYKVEDEEELGALLRRFRRREMVRIAWRDLAGWADLSETMTDLSRLAEASLQETLTLLHTWQCREMGTPTGTDGAPQSLVIVGMGKLGGHELNFSSDIDLIFAYPGAGRTSGASTSVTNEEFFLHLCRRLINVLGATTADGFVFRIDTRLRPYGNGGPLVMSFGAMEEYYQHHGREWERFAWIKARVVAGDRKVGAYLLKKLRPFVYRRYLDYGVFDSLKKMKQMIAVEVRSKRLQNNIKLGPGGIREVEFFVQVFQLIRGGMMPPLQESSLLTALSVLCENNYLPREVCKELNEAYMFSRMTEHRLQEFADRQAHDIPRGQPERTRLSLAMGFPDWAAFSTALDQHMNKIHEHFNALFATPAPDAETGRLEKELAGVWMGVADKDQGKKVLAAAGFDKPEAILHLLNNLRTAPDTRLLSPEGRDRFDRLIPLLLKEAGASKHPIPVLNRLLDLIMTIVRRTCYIALLVENPTALSHLVRLCDASPWIVTFLTRHPLLLDELLDPRTLYTPPDRIRLEHELRQRLAHMPPEDLEHQMDELRVFKQANTLRIAAADVTDALPLMKVSDHLVDIAELIIEKALELAWNHLVDKYGRPLCALGEQVCTKGFAVIAYGKLGGIELGYDSDLDLVFLHAAQEGKTIGDKRHIDNAFFFSRLAQRVIHMLTAHTPAGVAYKVDMRLRPSGKAGLLVGHVEAFADYQMHEAWTWEHQAIVRARPVVGDPLLAERFEEIRRQVLCRPRDPQRLRQEISDMRSRLRSELVSRKPGVFDLKQGPGGIVDIEFMVQYLILLGARNHEALVGWTDNVRLLEAVTEAGLLSAPEASLLKEAYLTYRYNVHRLSLQKIAAEVPEDSFKDLRAAVRKIWKKLME